MSRARKFPTPLAAIALATLLLSGCTQATPTRFYTLSDAAAAPGETLALRDRDLAVAIGSVTLPDYLNRPQLVNRTGSNQVALSDFDNWVEPLESMFARTLAENLSLLLRTDDVLTLPQRRPFRPKYQVDVEVARFDTDSAGQAVLDARWWLIGARSERVLHGARATLAEPVAAGDRAAGVSALSRALGALSREIAAAIEAEEVG
jgi:uncharacterized lipoprotein YmbA